MRDDDPNVKETSETGVSRREFLKISAVTVAVPAVVGPTVLEIDGQQVAVHGPGKTLVTLTINGKKYTAQLEPRVTLLDALRGNFDLTGAKRVCDRGECGSCTVLLNGRTVYACSVLAIDAQGHDVSTIEGITQGNQPAPVQAMFVANDAQQCGFCTPGFIMSSKYMLEKNPHPTHDEVVKGLSGHFCRCGTYFGMRTAMDHSAERKGA